jgi:hypothetical protein
MLISEVDLSACLLLFSVVFFVQMHVKQSVIINTGC